MLKELTQVFLLNDCTLYLSTGSPFSCLDWLGRKGGILRSRHHVSYHEAPAAPGWRPGETPGSLPEPWVPYGDQILLCALDRGTKLVSWCNFTALFQYAWKPLIMQTALPASISREKWAIILMELPNWSHAYCMRYNVFLSELCSEVPPCFIFKWMCISHVVCTQYDYENSLIYLLSKHKDKFEFLLSDKFKFLFSGFCKKNYGNIMCICCSYVYSVHISSYNMYLYHMCYYPVCTMQYNVQSHVQMYIM